jgi:diguanylate cyclase (GGDEF)-like protein
MSTRRGPHANRLFTAAAHHAAMPNPSGPSQPLIDSLQDSRSRWRGLALLDAALVFESDAAGRLVFVAPDPALGRPAAAWLGAPLEALLGAAPPRAPCRGLRFRVPLEDGAECCLELAAAPLPGGGLRGLARDVTLAEQEAAATGRALRHATTLGRLLRLGTRQRGAEGGAAAALSALLQALPTALPAEGATLLAAEDGAWRCLLGGRPPAPRPLPHHALAESSAGPALFAWRHHAAAPFEADERELLAALAMPAAALQAEAARQAELDSAARTDALTGLLNRFAFERGLARRLAAGATGTLVFADLDGLKRLNDTHGHEAGDAALAAMGARIAAAAAAGDLAARLGGDEFCLWLDGLGEAAAEARVAGLGRPGPLPGLPAAGPAALRASVGLATRQDGEALAALLGRADAAMYAVKRARGAGRAA